MPALPGIHHPVFEIEGLSLELQTVVGELKADGIIPVAYDTGRSLFISITHPLRNRFTAPLRTLPDSIEATADQFGLTASTWHRSPWFRDMHPRFLAARKAHNSGISAGEAAETLVSAIASTGMFEQIGITLRLLGVEPIHETFDRWLIEGFHAAIRLNLKQNQEPRIFGDLGDDPLQFRSSGDAASSASRAGLVIRAAKTMGLPWEGWDTDRTMRVLIPHEAVTVDTPLGRSLFRVTRHPATYRRWIDGYMAFARPTDESGTSLTVVRIGGKSPFWLKRQWLCLQERLPGRFPTPVQLFNDLARADHVPDVMRAFCRDRLAQGAMDLIPEPFTRAPLSGTSIYARGFTAPTLTYRQTKVATPYPIVKAHYATELEHLHRLFLQQEGVLADQPEIPETLEFPTEVPGPRKTRESASNPGATGATLSVEDFVL